MKASRLIRILEACDPDTDVRIYYKSDDFDFEAIMSTDDGNLYLMEK